MTVERAHLTGAESVADAGSFQAGDGIGPCPSLEGLQAHIGDCHRCALGDTRTRLVFGVGDPHARLMFVGEAPGRNEDLQGEPFVGAAGKLLDELLAHIGLSRERVYIANVLKCRPPGNRDPLPDEIATCTPFLAEQIRLIDPTVIATLGNFATRFVLGTQRPISAVRGRLFRLDGRCVVPIFHPAAALYDRAKHDVLFEDFRRLGVVLDRGCAGADGPGARAEGADEAVLDAARPATEGGVAAKEAPSGAAAQPGPDVGDGPTPVQEHLF